MERTFAGFWRDGAVVKPEVIHCDRTSYVVAMEKKTGEYFCKTLRYPVGWSEFYWLDGWSEFYWLDTTTPTELTPQEAFELVLAVHPKCTGIEKVNGFVSLCGPIDSIVNWNGTTEYPPKKKWRAPTDADKGKRCRYKDEEKAEWMNRDNVLFMSTWNEGFWVVYGNEAPCFWKHCEVLD